MHGSFDSVCSCTVLPWMPAQPRVRCKEGPVFIRPHVLTSEHHTRTHTCTQTYITHSHTHNVSLSDAAGYAHAGHARTFWAAAQRARGAGSNGTLILRNEDLDGDRSKPEVCGVCACVCVSV